jgi:hypothetical protein
VLSREVVPFRLTIASPGLAMKRSPVKGWSIIPITALPL